MRISGGELCGRRLKTPPGLSMRPTQDRVREALFSILMSVTPDALFVDLYAGSGAVGLEACSRGARRVIWVEKDARHVEFLRQNIKALASDKGEAFCCDVMIWLKGVGKGLQADVVFADPPYAAGREQGFVELMSMLVENRVLRCGGFFVAEMPVAARPEVMVGWELLRDRTYGHTRLAVYQLESNGDKVAGAN